MQVEAQIGHPNILKPSFVQTLLAETFVVLEQEQKSNCKELSCLNQNNEKILVHLRSVRLDSRPLSSLENLV